MIKLTDNHLEILGQASDREDGLVTRPQSLKPAAATKVAAKLVDLGLVREVRAKGDMPIWRTDDQGRGISLKILKAGRVVVESASAKKIEPDLPVEDATIAVEALPAKAPAGGQPAGSGSKRCIILCLMERQEGATIGDLMAATGWLAHTTRAALSGLRKKGVVIVRDRDPAQQASVYRIESQSSAAAA